jgi:hypothetical protein
MRASVHLLRKVLVLAFVVALPFLASTSVLAGALALGSRAHGHPHVLALRGDGAHVDVVLSHASSERPDCDRRGAGVLAPAGCCGVPLSPGTHGDDPDADSHAVHVTAAGAGLALRGLAPPAASLAGAPTTPLCVVAAPVPLAVSPRALDAALHPRLSRSPVLRI